MNAAPDRPAPSDRRTKCAVCGIPLTGTPSGEPICNDRACRSQRQREQFESLRDEAAVRGGIADPQSYPLAVLPANEARIVPLPENRRRAFERRLSRLLRQAAAKAAAARRSGEEDSDAATTGSGTSDGFGLVAQACGLCRGSCCRQGRDHAFLDVDALRNVLLDRPDERPQDILQEYLELIPAETCEDSCLYHTAAGCALPRSMRSSICNKYECCGLEDLRSQLEQTGSRRGFVLAVSEDQIRRAAFLDSEQIHAVLG